MPTSLNSLLSTKLLPERGENSIDRPRHPGHSHPFIVPQMLELAQPLADLAPVALAWGRAFACFQVKPVFRSLFKSLIFT